MSDILNMGREEILALRRNTAPFFDTAGVFHIAQVFGAYWQYDYRATEAGRLGYHAELKSGNHSDGFFAWKVIAEQAPNLVDIIAEQLFLKIGWRGLEPTHLLGIPDGATSLGKAVAKIAGLPYIDFHKENGVFVPDSEVPSRAHILLVEDVFTKGTAFLEMGCCLKKINPQTIVIPAVLALLNRGGSDVVFRENGTVYEVVPLASQKFNDWPPEECPLCKRGSKALRPKASNENWRLLTTGEQLIW